MTDPGRSYDSYAEFCLKIASRTPDRNSRVVLREMAAEWLKLWSTGTVPRSERLEGHALNPDGHAPDKDLTT